MSSRLPDAVALVGVAYASSAAVYDRADGLRVTEDADGHPTSYADDVARRFIDAARTASTDAVVRNLGGPSEDVTDVIAAIAEVAPEAAGKITFKRDVLLPLPEDMQASR